MNRRGQVFLLMTILTLTFLITISTVLLDIQRAQYSEPSPDADKLFEAWEVAVNSAEQIVTLFIANGTQTGINPTDSQFDTQLSFLETYIQSRGLATSINRVNLIVYTAPGLPAASVFVALSVTIQISITSSSGVEIHQQLQINMRFQAIIIASILSIEKVVNGEIEYINTAQVAPQGAGNVINTGTGSYTLIGTDNYDITTPEQVLLTVANP